MIESEYLSDDNRLVEKMGKKYSPLLQVQRKGDNNRAAHADTMAEANRKTGCEEDIIQRINR